MKIAHLSDIQIRTFKRHDEFRRHFENLYRSLRLQCVDAIVVVGDIVHQKSNISPELMDMCVDFFKSLAAIAPLHIIPGNHDGVLNNLSRISSVFINLSFSYSNESAEYFLKMMIVPI